MKKILIAIFSVALLVCACDRYDDSALQNRIDNVESRLSALEALVSELNTNVSSVQALVKALQSEITIDVISQTKDGYSITFSDGQVVTLKNGEKGDKGDKGDTGAAGAAPVIGVKAAGGVYYWTLNGEWLLDADGARIPVTGPAPQLKIEKDMWYVSYDGGATWKELGKQEGAASSDLAITEDANYVYFTFASTGETITISKSSRFTIDIEAAEYAFKAGVTEIPYKITGADGTEKLFATSNEFDVKIDASKIAVTPKEGVTGGEVLIIAVRNSDQAVCGVVLTFSEGVFEVSQAQAVAAEGGEVEIKVKTSVDYEVIIPDDAKSWVAIVPVTKAVREDVLVFGVQPNDTEADRSAKIEFKPAVGESIVVTIFQYAKGTVAPQAVSVADFVAAPVSTDVWYQLTGKIANLKAGDKFGNFDLVDESGTVYVYGVLSEKGGEKAKFQDLVKEYGIANGGTITIIANRGEFNDVNKGSIKIEAVNAYFVSYVPGESGGEDTPEDIIDVTVSEFLRAAESVTQYYRLTGEVKNIASTTYGNFTIEDATGSVYVYGLTSTMQDYDKENAKWPNDKSFASLGIKVGDTVTIVGTRGSYGETIEMCGAYCEKVVPGDGGGTSGGGEATGEFSSSITWELGESAYDQAGTVNGESVEHLLKLGTSSKAGNAILTIPSGTKKIGFYAIGWKGTSPTLTVGDKEIAINGNNGASGNAPYTISVTGDDYYEVSVSSGSVTVTCDKRVIIFGINVK